jgi:hypothetical protein
VLVEPSVLMLQISSTSSAGSKRTQTSRDPSGVW